MSSATTPAAGDERDRPNVLLLTAHDLGRHLGCYGVDTVDTPNLDGLADRGVRFDRAFASAPVCSPSRGSLHTGRYPQSNGLLGLTHQPWWWRLDESEVTLPEHLGRAGYATHLFGVQHVAPDPDRLGFDTVASEGNDAAETVAGAVDLFDRVAAGEGDRPFFAQVGFFEAHRSFDRGEYRDEGVYVPPYLRDTERMRDDLAEFQATINYLDARVGDVLDGLDDADLREDTVVVFAADHGIPYPGAKWWCRSAGLEISLLADGPGAAFAERDSVDALASNVDVLPTLLDVVDLPVPDRVEGESFVPYLAGETDDPPREAVFSQYTDDGDEARGVITDRFTLVRNFGAGRPVEYPVDCDPTARVGATRWEPRPFAQLYDRADDPAELANVGDEREGTVATLSTRLREWMARVDDPVLTGGVRYPYSERAVRDLLTTGPGPNSTGK